MAADDDADVFEITDFTTASDWERFIARLEEILHEWRLVNLPALPPVAKGEFTSETWEERTDELQFSDVKFDLTYHYLKSAETTLAEKTREQEEQDDTKNEDATPTVFEDMMSMDNDFPSRAHCLCRWYGLRSFIVLSPKSTADIIDIESRAKLLLSSVNIALGNTGCTVPMFVQIQQKWRRLYLGTSVLPNATISFDMAHLKKLPMQYNHLAGLLDVFKSELGHAINPLPTVAVSVRFTYILEEWTHSLWPQTPPDFSIMGDEDVGCKGFGMLPFGACEDPVNELHLSCTWPCLSENIIVENQVYTDLDPLQAPQWSVRITMTEDPQCLLHDYLEDFIFLCHNKSAMKEVFTPDDDPLDSSADISQALHRLTEPAVPTLSSVMSQATNKVKVKTIECPIGQPLFNEILFFLFPDARPDQDPDTINQPSEDYFEVPLSRVELKQEMAKQLKSAPLDSLTTRMATCLCLINRNHGGWKAVAQLWQEIVLELRYRLDNNYLISGIESGPPNMGSCILHQKLQMLNCCIEKRRKREMQSLENARAGSPQNSSPHHNRHSSGEDSPWDSPRHSMLAAEMHSRLSPLMKHNLMRPDSRTSASIDSYSGSDEEFFDCDEHQKEASKSEDVEMEDESESGFPADAAGGKSKGNGKDLGGESYVSTEPEGRLRVFGNAKLLNINEQLYIPVTQEPAPMTEDMLEEHAEVLARLGSSAEGSQLRARMQSACLLSDMESFKAANPGCMLEDFVRWYSPRDWVDEQVDENGGVVVVKGQLSQRMKIPGNMWSEVWQGARAVPSHRQKRLFDDTKEAEKVLHFLMSLKPPQLVEYLLPVLSHTAILKIIQEEDQEFPKLKQLLDQIISKAAKVTRSTSPGVRKYEDLIQMISLAETVIARAKSLKNKFTKDLLEQKEAEEELTLFVSSLLQQSEVIVRGGPYGPAGSVIHKLFVAAQKAAHLILEDESSEDQPNGNAETEKYKPPSTVPDFPEPSGREYILRTIVPRPAPYSRSLPQRMYCVLVDGDYRLAGAYTSDTLFE
ncbi:rab3 GTPase-activating protein catalytic subunit [Octopus bimaculoides]|uniref:Rab3 GTPase-activating protein catalytic subunit n=1 Tax=Octopus bimaculoides TaxID=37653 RepID=A0A0L8GWC3_OCTBM|nr:rab3 GTPase-activating protein catalytic subunit [Octopus bimaculoides]|eukprot:XP_014777563.1 PREDICTED: rab3 GTPase-activating protein catalytic subunit-like isoform X1 [Octopus bimaculoides]